jgi:S-adenosyl-L-methionine hydrolase (adenosine-forming)
VDSTFVQCPRTADPAEALPRSAAVPAPVITFLTDYGRDDDFVGICHGVIARVCPQARVIDLTHGIPPQDVLAGALALARALPYVPAGVHLAVVDPGVGGTRRGVAIRTGDGRHLVGPDNGLLWPAAQAAGGAAAVADLVDSPLALRPLSATFHGRDVFAPVAAGLAGGLHLERVGDPIDPAGLVVLEPPAAHREGDALVVVVLAVDHFGNVQLSAGLDELDMGPPALQALRVGDHVAQLGRTFADVPAGELLLYEDAQGRLALAVNGASAAALLGVGAGAKLRLCSR